MSTLDLSQSLVKAEADVSAGDWGKAAAGLSLDVTASAEINRGIDIQLGASALAELSASFSKFVAADAEVRGTASARLRAQIQAPLDLFSESGMAVRLQAVAEAGISIRLALGLSFGDFLKLVDDDPNIQGVPAELLKIFLEEMNVQAGVVGKVAFSAMAYANLVISGRLVEGDNLPPGFTVAGEYGMGLKGGCGFQLFANFGFKDTGRAIRRTVDILVDATIAEMKVYIPDQEQQEIIDFFKAPAKMVLRSGFEIGFALAESAQSAISGGGELAERTVQVLLEELQRFILEQLSSLGTILFKRALAELGISQERWDASESQRNHFADLLRSLPEDPFDLSNGNNAEYWAQLVNAGVAIAVELSEEEIIEANWVEPLATMWSSVQLLFSITQRVSSASARVDFFGAVNFGTGNSVPAFTGNLATNGAPPPTIIKEHINQRLNKNVNSNINQDAIVEYLVSDVIIGKLIDEFPELKPILGIVMGNDSSSFVEAIQTILRNASSFVDNNGNFDAQGTLEVLSAGLQAYMRDRIDDELRPMLLKVADEDENLALYIDDVILTTFNFTVDTVFQRIISFGVGHITGRQALKEACSSICMKLFGRSLVVTYDILMAFALAEVSGQFKLMADYADDPGGIADQVADVAGLQNDREFVAEVIEDTLQITSQVFKPLPDESRARIRSLLYSVIDSVPSDPGENWLEDLKNNPLIQQATYNALLELTEELGGILANNLTQFLSLVLIKIAEKSLEILSEYLQAGLDQVNEWLDVLNQTAQELYQWFQSLPQRFAELAAQIDDAIDDATVIIENILNIFADSSRRRRLSEAIEDEYKKRVKTVLKDNIVYKLAPSSSLFGITKSQIVDEVINFVADNISSIFVNPILDVLLSPIASTSIAILEEVEELISDLRQVDSNVNITSQVSELLLDWFANQIREAFGGRNPSMEIKLVGIIDLGTVAFPLNKLIRLIKNEIRSSDISIFEEWVRDLVREIQRALELNEEETALKLEETAKLPQRQEVELMLSESQLTNLDVLILEPSPSAEYQDDLDIEIVLEGVPLSYLGLGEATIPRVFILLNNEQLDLSSFSVTQRNGNSGYSYSIPLIGALDNLEQENIVSNEELIYQPGDYAGLFGKLDVNRPKASNRINGSYKEAVYHNMSNHIAKYRALATGSNFNKLEDTQPLVNRNLVKNNKLRIRSYNARNINYETAVKTSALVNRPGRVKLSSHTPKTYTSLNLISNKTGILNSNTVGSASVNMANSTTLNQKLLGNILTFQEKAQILSKIDSGLVLKQRIPIKDLKEGINTLSVGLANGAMVRKKNVQYPLKVQETVSFLVTAPEQNTNNKPSNIRNVRYDNLPTPLRNALLREEALTLSDSSLNRINGDRSIAKPQRTSYGLYLPPRSKRQNDFKQGIEKMRNSMNNKTKLLEEYNKVLNV